MRHRFPLQRRSATVLVASAMLVLAITACASESSSDLDLPPKNEARWVTPMDAYLPSPEAQESAYYASLLVETHCLTNAGYPETVPFRDPARSWRSKTLNAAGVRLFTVEIASEFGYHEAPTELGNRAEWKRFLYGALSPGADAALQSCRDDPSEAVPDVDRIHNELVGFAMAADERAQQSKEVKAAAAAWRECMAPLGVADLPDAPWDMPSPTQYAEFGLEGDGGHNTDHASPEEIAVAVDDATCQKSTGFSNAYYEAVWAEEVKLLRENLPAFERGRAEWKKALEVTARLIAEYGR